MEITYRLAGEVQGMCLVAVLDPSLTAFTCRWPMAEFRVDHRHYRDAGRGVLTGFYDWLRDAGGAVIGVRYWPSESDDEFDGAMTSLSYVHRRGPAVEIYFSAQRAYVDEQSSDQEFMYDAVFTAASDRWAIAFDVAALADVGVSVPSLITAREA